MAYIKETWTNGSGNAIDAASLTHLETQYDEVMNESVQAPTANKIVKRDASGRAQVAEPVAPEDISTKNYVDSLPSVTSIFLGQVAGEVVEPWLWAPTQDHELWRLNNFRIGLGNNSTLSPELTANGTSQNLDTLAYIGNTANRDRSFRLKFTLSDVPTDGWVHVSVAVVDNGNNLIVGTQEQMIRNGPGAGGGGAGINMEQEFDFNTHAWGAGGTLVRVRLNLGNNATVGKLRITNVSLREIAWSTPPMRYGFRGGAGALICVPLWDARSKTYGMAESRLGLISDPEWMLGADGYNSDRVFRYDPPDQNMLETTESVVNTIPSMELMGSAGEIGRSLRSQNNDHIFNVRKASGAYELRGNVHGGEAIRTPTATHWKAEASVHGDGVWIPFNGSDQHARECRLFRFQWNTSLTLSAPDNVTFANSDHQQSFFPDGMVRMDRRTTFLVDTVLGSTFEWMSSHNFTVPKVGRVGNGLIVQGEIDTFPQLPRPAIPTFSTATTGGTLPAGTYRYVVSALGETGETLPSLSGTQTTTGATSTVTVNWAAVAGAQGYRIYGRTNFAGSETLLATVGPAITSWVDTGAVPLGGPSPVKAATDRQLSASSTQLAAFASATASWACWYDPIINMCYGNIYDRDALAARDGINVVQVRLERGSGIMKNYVNIYNEFDAALPPVAEQESGARTYTANTVWTATHWSYTWMPADPANYHAEIAARASNLTTLKEIYPNLFDNPNPLG